MGSVCDKIVSIRLGPRKPKSFPSRATPPRVLCAGGTDPPLLWNSREQDYTIGGTFCLGLSRPASPIYRKKLIPKPQIWPFQEEERSIGKQPSAKRRIRRENQGIFPKARVQMFDLFQIHLLKEILNSVTNLSILQISNVSKFIILSHSNPSAS